MYLSKAPNCGVCRDQDGANSTHAIIRLSVAASLARAPAGGLLVAGLVTSSTHVWHGNCTATGTWTPPCARHGVSQYLKCAPCIHCLPIVLLLFPSLKIITEFINTFIFCVLTCLYYLLLHRLPQLSTHTLNTRAWKHQKKRIFGWFYGKLRCPRDICSLYKNWISNGWRFLLCIFASSQGTLFERECGEG